MLRALDIDADLSLRVNGHTVQIRGQGDTVVVEVSDLRTIATLLRSGPFRERRAARLKRLHEALLWADVRLEVHLKGRSIARLGTGAETGAIARALKLCYTEPGAGESVHSVRKSARWGGALAALLAGATTLLLLWRGRGQET